VLKENLAKTNYLLGVSLFNTGKYKEAIEQFELCREVFKESDELKLPNWIAEAYFQSGLDMLKTGKLQPNADIAEQAGQLFDKAMEINPEAEKDYLILKGICELFLGENHLTKAVEFFDKVLKHNPENDIAAFFSGLCNFLQEGDKEKQALALEKFKSLLNKEKADDNMKYMAQFIVACEEIKNGNNGAIDTLLPLLKEQEVINRFPFPIIPFNSWLAGHMVQHYDSESVGKVQEIHNSSDLFQYALALVHSIKGNYEKAISHFEKIYQENEKNKKVADQYANMLCYRAAKNVKKEKVKEALTDLNLAKRVLVNQ
jgi:tetratricopeptide (TPR) repeat protein